MDTRVAQLKSDFNNIVTIRSTVKGIFDTLKQRIDKLKHLYSEFIQHNDNNLFVFGLDSFRFQSKLIDIEYDDMMRLFLAINNRMYCEYFKLYKIIIAYIHETIEDKKIIEIIKVNNFPVYKDLEPYKEYKFEIVLDLHENILILLSSIMNSIENKETELEVYQKKRRIGLNIDNFVTTFNYDITMMREKVGVFLTYIEFFHILHTKYLKRFSNKIQLMYSHINNDIKFDESIEMNREKKVLQDENIVMEQETFKRTDIESSSLIEDVVREVNMTPNTIITSELHLCSFKTPTPWAVMSEEGDADCAFSMRNGVKTNDETYTAFNNIDTNCDALLNKMTNQSKLKGVVKKVMIENKVKQLLEPISEQSAAHTQMTTVEEEWITPGKKKNKQKR